MMELLTSPTMTHVWSALQKHSPLCALTTRRSKRFWRSTTEAEFSVQGGFLGASTAYQEGSFEFQRSILSVSSTTSFEASIPLSSPSGVNISFSHSSLGIQTVMICSSSSSILSIPHLRLWEHHTNRAHFLSSPPSAPRFYISGCPRRPMPRPRYLTLITICKIIWQAFLSLRRLGIDAAFHRSFRRLVVASFVDRHVAE